VSTYLVRALFVVPVAVMLMGAARLIDPPPVDTPAMLSELDATNVVRATLVKRGWLLTQDSGNEIIASLNVRTHMVKVKFVVAERKIRVSYVDSVNLEYQLNSRGEPTIHRKYGGWVQNLITAFQQEMQVAALAKSN
jgi:hypothetical protein